MFDTYTQIFVRVDPYENYTFFSFQYVEYSSNKNDNKKINEYPPQNLGATYERVIKKDEILSLIPMKPENDFKFLTYHTALKKGNFKAYIYKCENYPLCNITSELLKEEDQLIDYNSASISYNNSEYETKLSPLSKSQKMLVITCETETCELLTSMYTDKNKLNIILTVPYYKIIRKKIKINIS